MSFNGRGTWEVAVPDAPDPMTCETLQDAREVAYRQAADRHPCHVIVCDAYHRVLHRELVPASAGFAA